MIKVHCRTNLDLHDEKWPKELPAVPNIGDKIQSATKHDKFQLELEIVSITWKQGAPIEGRIGKEGWYPEIELDVISKKETN